MMDRDNGLRRPRPRNHSFTSRSSRVLPYIVLFLIGKFLRLFSVYVVYQYLIVPGSSVVIFMFSSLSLAAITFLAIHQPWRGRPLTSYQLIPTILNGAIVAMSYVLWGEGLRLCGPLKTVMSEYIGAVFGAISTLILGRAGGKWKKVAGLVAMLASYIFLSQGWTMSTYSPFSYGSDAAARESTKENANIGFSSMVLVFLAGVLSGLSRVIARRVSLKTQMKRRLNVVTVTGAACFLFPLAVFQATQVKSDSDSATSLFPSSTVLLNTMFGIILSFYIDPIAEERLNVSFTSPKHLLTTSGFITILEIAYGMDFSILGFSICTSLLGLGIFEATSVEKIQRDPDRLPTQVDEMNNSLIMSPVMEP